MVMNIGQHAGPRDRLRRPLQVHDFVVVDGPQPLVQITNIRPHVAPSGPRGTVIEAIATFQYVVQDGRQASEVLLVHRPAVQPPELSGEEGANDRDE